MTHQLKAFRTMVYYFSRHIDHTSELHRALKIKQPRKSSALQILKLEGFKSKPNEALEYLSSAKAQ